MFTIKPASCNLHQSHESVANISQAKGHLQKFKEAKCFNNSCLRDVIWVHRNLIISLHQIQFRESSTASQPSWKLGDVWQWLPIWSCCIVEPGVITAWAPGPICFRHHMEREAQGLSKQQIIWASFIAWNSLLATSRCYVPRQWILCFGFECTIINQKIAVWQGILDV